MSYFWRGRSLDLNGTGLVEGGSTSSSSNNTSTNSTAALATNSTAARPEPVTSSSTVTPSGRSALDEIVLYGAMVTLGMLGRDGLLLFRRLFRR